MFLLVEREDASCFTSIAFESIPSNVRRFGEGIYL
jgi:hypothetical protein